MKKFLVFTVVLLSSFSNTIACGYSPYGEDVRYSLLQPSYFNYGLYSSFYYHANLFGFDYEQETNFGIEANISDWHNYTNKKVSINAIQEFNDLLVLTDINTNCSNEFVKYLYQNNKTEAINYLKMAKNCEFLNSVYQNDAWEINTKNTEKRKKLIKKLITITNVQKDSYFKRKYAFLTIRLAYYDDDFQTINQLFKANFTDKNKDYLYYWSLYFTLSDKENNSINAANLMAYSPEKSYASYYYFHGNFNLKKALQMAKNKEEIANCYAYASVQKIDKNLNYLKEIYKNNPKSAILGFLLLREMNKIEDWVYTPYYTNYTPSVEFSDYYYDYKNKDKVTTETLRNRSEKDRLYAQEVLNFVNSININLVENKTIWLAAQINLQFMSKNYAACLQSIQAFEKNYKTEKVFEQIEQIKALCITANQVNGKAIIQPEIESIILKYKNNQHFIFALGRELEFRGNITDGLALISMLENKEIENDYYDYNGNSDVEWMGNRLKKSGNLVSFYTYFDYLDFVYSAKELQIIINKLENNLFEKQFQKTIYSKLLIDKNLLKELLGTKYLREDNLTQAFKQFKQLGEKYWEEKYNPWERYNSSYYDLFEENPFFQFKYTEDFINKGDRFLVTKLSIVENLIKYTNLAENSKTENRDYYYFIIANCYYNMTESGHSWMMRRFQSYSNYSNDDDNQSYIDEVEYRSKNKAIENYQMAYKLAKTDKFKALCLRMMSYADDYSNHRYSNKLKKEYPDFYDDLSGCENLEEYFNARR